LNQIIAVGNDAVVPSTKQTGSLLIESMTVAGA
jgi:hypothetical protein